MAVLATDPALSFLSTVSGVTPETVPMAIDLMNAPAWNGVKPTLVASTDLGETGETLLPAAGLVRTGDRILALQRLEVRPATTLAARLDVVDAGEGGTSLQVLLAGYEVDEIVAAFIRADHRLPMMWRFLAVEREEPIAAATMTIHGDVAVFGAPRPCLRIGPGCAVAAFAAPLPGSC